MQEARLKEIQIRSDHCKAVFQPPTEIISKSINEDIPYMLKVIRALQYEIYKKSRTLDLANKALKRAGSAAQFGIKRDIPEGALVFKDTAESLANIADVYCDCELLQQSKNRERALRQALERIYNATAPDRGLTMHETTQIYVRAREALKQEGQA